MNRWAELQAFVMSVNEGNFSAAARVSGLSPSAVSKLITRLETRLGVRLLNRTTRQISLTEAGQAFYLRCNEILHEMEDAEAEMAEFGLSPQGILKVSCSPGFANHQLLPLLPEFHQLYPDLALELKLTGTAVDLVAEGIDVAIRLGELAESSMVASPLGTCRRVICASREYLQKHKPPEKPADLLNHNCLRLSTVESVNQWSFMVGELSETINVEGNFITDNVETLYQYAVAGGGVIRLSRFMLHDALKEGKLVPLLSEYETNPQWVNMIYPHRRFLPVKVRVFIDFLKEKICYRNW